MIGNTCTSLKLINHSITVTAVHSEFGIVGTTSCGVSKIMQSRNAFRLRACTSSQQTRKLLSEVDSKIVVTSLFEMISRCIELFTFKELMVQAPLCARLEQSSRAASA